MDWSQDPPLSCALLYKVWNSPACQNTLASLLSCALRWRDRLTVNTDQAWRDHTFGQINHSSANQQVEYTRLSVDSAPWSFGNTLDLPSGIKCLGTVPLTVVVGVLPNKNRGQLGCSYNHFCICISGSKLRSAPCCCVVQLPHLCTG